MERSVSNEHVTLVLYFGRRELPTEADQIIVIEATGLQGVREMGRAEQKFRTTSKLSDYSSYLWIEKK